MKKIKAVAYCVSLAVAALAGDHYDVLDRFVNPIRYKDVLLAGGFYRQPFMLKKKYEVNEAGFLEVYIGNGDYYAISDELRVNERKLDEHIKDEAKGFIKRGKEKLESIMNSVNEVYEGVKDD